MSYEAIKLKIMLLLPQYIDHNQQYRPNSLGMTDQFLRLIFPHKHLLKHHLYKQPNTVQFPIMVE